MGTRRTAGLPAPSPAADVVAATEGALVAEPTDAVAAGRSEERAGGSAGGGVEAPNSDPNSPPMPPLLLLLPPEEDAAVVGPWLRPGDEHGL